MEIIKKDLRKDTWRLKSEQAKQTTRIDFFKKLSSICFIVLSLRQTDTHVVRVDKVGLSTIEASGRPEGQR